MPKTEKLINAFRATSDTGKEFTIQEFQEFSDEVPTLKILKTSDGYVVTRIEKGLYKVIGYNEVILRSDDPKAS